MTGTDENIKVGWGERAIKIMIPFFIISAGIGIAVFLYATKPSAQRGAQPAKPPLVQVITAVRSNHRVVIPSMGAVTPSRSLAIKSRVAGFVFETSDRFVPGGIFKRGEVILKLDPRDFELTVEREKALVHRAEAELNLERGKQEVARAELSFMESSSGKRLRDPGLALRKPQLAQVEADLEMARVDLEQAMIDLERTVISAPFNCMVMEKKVENGSQITAQESLATLAGTDEYWVTALVAMDQLSWIRFPMEETDKGSPVQVVTRDKRIYRGEVVKLLGDIGEKSRLARVVVAVKDPLGLDTKTRSQLLINSYVTMAIQGRTIHDIIALPRECARDGSTVWIARDNQLMVEPVETVWANNETLFIKSGVIPGDKVVVSDLSSAVHAMAIRVVEAHKDGK
ncbi:MAG: efflux RND transporter periplasmic adaptor subunit [Desulfobacterium sp.]|jgi:RND family efflux transporter MFP subunit|nr:efflux RND transporter periplasmic adaptor subunit [Desulfobacterium sp.]